MNPQQKLQQLMQAKGYRVQVFDTSGLGVPDSWQIEYYDPATGEYIGTIGGVPATYLEVIADIQQLPSYNEWKARKPQ